VVSCRHTSVIFMRFRRDFVNTHAVPLLIQNPRNATDSHRHDTFRICLDDSGLDYVDRTLQWGVGRDLLCLTYVCPVHPLKCSACTYFTVAQCSRSRNYYNKCTGDDTKAGVRRSPNCIRKTKRGYLSHC